jgi:hypothetical protein
LIFPTNIRDAGEDLIPTGSIRDNRYPCNYSDRPQPVIDRSKREEASDGTADDTADSC